ncbi:O-methyltransferase [Antarcticibacterium flavum]|uniref:O-methyltransferase n=1 Tax=Antarcticibacterium flavum TaxID=2058175 RepID=A0A5B7X6L2_9FLAO|nr:MULTISPECIES: O-methyltransferase [Antarcticibacterium]MCM4160032.1 methyltransferase [Antarcticibacterium sp. W02-3]QCY70382.1 O-methyltransferase [Antarcticibacterium flavum]
MHFIPEALDEYSLKHTQAEPSLLAKLTRETYQKVLQPRMLSGHYQGRLLSLLSKIINPQHILELGTYTGYSALCLAEGLKEGGELHTIDINEELTDIQKKYFDLSDYKDRIHQHLGPALEIIPSINIKFDLVFMDADKPNYPAYLDLIIDKINPGGVLLTDNVLWSGKVVEEIKADDISTLALVEYNKRIAEDPRVETIMLPIRDGLSITRVK